MDFYTKHCKNVFFEALYENSRLSMMFLKENIHELPVLHYNEIICSNDEIKLIQDWSSKEMALADSHKLFLRDLDVPDIVKAIKDRIMAFENLSRSDIYESSYVDDYFEIIGPEKQEKTQLFPNIGEKCIHVQYIIPIEKTGQLDGMPIINNSVLCICQGAYARVLSGIYPLSTYDVSSSSILKQLVFSFLLKRDYLFNLHDKSTAKEIILLAKSELCVNRRLLNLIPSKVQNSLQLSALVGNKIENIPIKPIKCTTNNSKVDIQECLDLLSFLMEIQYPFKDLFQVLCFMSIPSRFMPPSLFKFTNEGSYTLNILVVNEGGFVRSSLLPPRDATTLSISHYCALQPEIGGYLLMDSSLSSFNVHDCWSISMNQDFNYSYIKGNKPLIILELEKK